MSNNATTGATGPSPRTGLSAGVDLSRRSRPGERAITMVLQVSAYLSIAITFGIILALIEPVLHFFGEVPLGDFFASEGRKPTS